MAVHTHRTAPTRYVEANGIRFAYRRFGQKSGDTVPLVFNMHLNGTMDHWDPAVTDAFVQALGLAQVDVLGFSLGGLVAQELAIAEPRLARRLVLVGTGPRSGEGMASLTPDAERIFGARYEKPDDLWLAVFFTPSERSQAAGRDYLKRFRLRTEDRDPEADEKVAPAQLEGLAKWGARREN